MWLCLAIFPLTGLIVFWLKPDNKQAVLLAMMLATCWQWGPSPQQLMTVIFFGYPSWLVAALILAVIIARGFASIFFHFFLVFPQPLSLLKRFPRFEFYLYLPFLLFSVPLFATELIARATNPDHAFGGWQSFTTVARFASIIFLLYLVA